jgi:hypothetical protein
MLVGCVVLEGLSILRFLAYIEAYIKDETSPSDPALGASKSAAGLLAPARYSFAL